MKSKHLALLVALAAAVPLASCERKPDYDLLIRGGTIYDGSGKPGFAGEVGIQGDRIVYVGASDGFLYALAATSGQMIYRFRIGGNIYSSPLISSEGNVYVGSSNGKIIGLRGSQGPAGIDWPMFRRDPKHLANVGLP